jgi:hypothetical protein
MLWADLLLARAYVKCAAALKELHDSGRARVPLAWTWPETLASPPRDGAPVSPLAAALALLLSLAEALPPALQPGYLATACPALSGQARKLALLTPRWALYTDWADDVLFHRGTDAPPAGSTYTHGDRAGDSLAGRYGHLQDEQPAAEDMLARCCPSLAPAPAKPQESPFPLLARRCVCSSACGWPALLQPWDGDVYQDLLGAPAHAHDDDAVAAASADALLAAQGDLDAPAAVSLLPVHVQRLRARRCRMTPYMAQDAVRGADATPARGDPVLRYLADADWVATAVAAAADPADGESEDAFNPLLEADEAAAREAPEAPEDVSASSPSVTSVVNADDFDDLDSYWQSQAQAPAVQGHGPNFALPVAHPARPPPGSAGPRRGPGNSGAPQ